MRPPNAPEENQAFPTRLGNFDIEITGDGKPRLLGKGTYGETYLAKHRFLESPAAIKVISERFLTEAKARERFLAEAKAVARLRHPHIAQVYDFGAIESGLFYAMEFCAGGNLAEWLQAHGAMPPKQLLAVAQQVASALKCCHAAGFIHRDLKPANLMLASADGSLVIKLIDFGLVQEESQGEDGAHRIGTPLYASPEQLKEQDVDARSDLFSLGMTLWHLATGRVPDSGSSAEVISSRLSATSYARQLPADMPAALRAVIESLVEKDRMRRPADAARVLDALNDAAIAIGVQIFTDLAYASEGGKAGAVQAAAASAAEVETFPGNLEDDFAGLEQKNLLGESASGRTYRASPVAADARPVLLHVLDLNVRANARLLDLVCQNVGQLAALKLPAVCAVGAIRAYADFTVILLAAPQGEDLFAALKLRGKIPIAEARQLLESVAATCDKLTETGLPGVELAAGQVFLPAGAGAGAADWQPRLMPRFLTLRDRTQAGETVLPSDDDASATLTPDTLTETSADDLPGLFARLLYRITAGRDSPAAAAISMQGYVAIPDLSEESNRTLAQVIGKTTGYTACGPLLGRILALEGMVGTSTASSHLKTGTRGTAATGTRPTFQKTAHVAPIAPLRTHGPAEPQPQKKRPLVAVFLAIAIAAAGAAGIWRANRPQDHKTTPPVPLQGATDLLPAGAIVRLKSPELPAPKFSANGTVLAAARTSDGWDLTIPDGGAFLPYEIVGEVPGFTPEKIRIESRRDIITRIEFFPKMQKGTLVFKTERGCDYTEVGVKMMRPLSDSTAPPPVSHVLSFPIEPSGSTTAELVPGFHMLTLQSAQGDAERRWQKEVEVRGGTRQEFILPPSWVGTYAGNLDVAGSAAPAGAKLNCRLNVEPNLIGTFEKNGRRCAFEKGRLDTEGNLKIRLRWSRVEQGEHSFDWMLTAKRQADATVSIEVTEARETDSNLEAELGRQPFTTLQWKAVGAMKATRE